MRIRFRGDITCRRFGPSADHRRTDTGTDDRPTDTDDRVTSDGDCGDG
jgi:hypothetical protein